jgi:hypothetical protein
MGQEGFNQNYLDGHIMEMVVYNAVISGTDRADLTQYFKNKWGSAPGGVDANMAFWLDFSDVGTLYQNSACSTAVTTNGQTVGCVTDKSGNGHSFIQTTGADEPTYTTGSLNGLSGLDFDGAGDMLEDADGHTNYINGSANFELFVVIQSDVTSSDKGFFITEAPSGSDDIIAARYDASGASWGCTNCMKAGIDTSDSGVIQTETATGTQSTSGQVVGVSWSSGTEVKMYVDGVVSSSGDNGAGTGTTSNATTVRVGQGPKDGTNGWDGKVLEVIFYNTELTAAERNAIMTNLRSKWGTP